MQSKNKIENLCNRKVLKQLPLEIKFCVQYSKFLSLDNKTSINTTTIQILVLWSNDFDIITLYKFGQNHSVAD